MAQHPDARTTGNSTPKKRRRSPADWLLPEDGIVDSVAVAIAAAGTRRVRLTPTERRLVAAHILAAGGSRQTVARRLHISYSSARALADQLVTEPRRVA